MENQEKDSQQETKARKAAMWPQLMEIGIDFAAYLAVPLLAFIFAGKWLDARTHHSKLFVIIGLFTALALSWFLIFKKIKAIKDVMDKK
ncbi:MAG: AtpZ/AtpI family protein [Candidatus Doudnabacteria bacterium]|nr:AtpZ/AtpI family protein [Candidatus Doudnabacteria bacterium]